MYTLDTLDTLSALIVNEKVTVSAGAPAIFMPLLEYIRGLDVKPNLKGTRLLSGASEPPVAMMKGFWDLTGAEIIHAYGATETTPLVTVKAPAQTMAGKRIGRSTEVGYQAQTGLRCGGSGCQGGERPGPGSAP